MIRIIHFFISLFARSLAAPPLDDSVMRGALQEHNKVEFTSDIYERLIYFSKVSAVASCICGGNDDLIPGKTLKEGGCPSHLAFCSDERVNPTANETTVELVLTAGSGDLGTGCLLVDHAKKVVIIALRASSTRQDWLSDFTIYPTRWEPTSKGCYENLVKTGAIRPCEHCKIHRGFYKFSETLAELFLDKIETIFNKYPEYHLVITGHSLGAALASIAGIELKLRGYDPLVITYANPMMFNSKMKEWVDELFDTKEIDRKCRENGRLDFEKGYFRVAHSGDYIPMLPPHYEEAGLEIFIKKKNLPHETSDLEYKGMKDYDADDLAEAQGIDWENMLLSSSDGDWLHRMEHCSYFIYISGCNGF